MAKELDVIGVFPLTNTGAVLIHAFDPEENKVLASISGQAPEWCDFTEEYWECTEELEPGFYMGSIFIPFCEVMRL